MASINLINSQIGGGKSLVISDLELNYAHSFQRKECVFCCYPSSLCGNAVLTYTLNIFI